MQHMFVSTDALLNLRLWWGPKVLSIRRVSCGECMTAQHARPAIIVGACFDQLICSQACPPA